METYVKFSLAPDQGLVILTTEYQWSAPIDFESFSIFTFHFTVCRFSNYNIPFFLHPMAKGKQQNSKF
jgi:hypothetical protein